MSTQSLGITLRFRDHRDTGPNEVPGWVLDVLDPESEGHLAAIDRESLSMSAVRDIADFIDGLRAPGGRSLASLVAAQHAKALSEAQANVRRKEALLAEIANAEEHLAALRAAMSEDEQVEEDR